LKSGDLVYARVCSAPSKYLDAVELECFVVSPTTGVTDTGLGPLKGGTVVDISLGFARRLMLGSKKGGVVVLEVLGERVGFEVAIGRNGRVWIGGEDVAVLAVVGRVLREVDERALDEKGQRECVARLLRQAMGT
jgi:exosome complex component RRP40